MRTIITTSVLALCLSMPAGAQTSVGTAFSYQGHLEEEGTPAEGAYDFAFELYDAESGGQPVGTTQFLDGVTVTDGAFSVVLDFGSAFGPDARWLEVAVRPADSSDPHVVLTPRQAVTPAPVALYSLSGGDAEWVRDGEALTNSEATSFVGINRSERQSGAEYFGVHAPVSSGYGGMYVTTETQQGWPFYGYASGAKSAWTYLDGNSGDWRLYNQGTRLTVTEQGSVLIGTTEPNIQGLTVEWDATAIIGRSAGAIGVYGESEGWQVGAVQGRSMGSMGYGVHGEGVGPNGRGVNGYGTAFGVYGRSQEGVGVFGISTTGNGVEAHSTDGRALYARSINGHAGWFQGDVYVDGNLGKASGSFRIDHPLDPRNKYLSHSFVESPDMLNIYSGNVTTDANGRAVVQMPGYFHALNTEFRYQLTVIGTFARAIIAEKIRDGRFVIETDEPHVEVSWQVTGIRDDPYARAHRIEVEQLKPAGERGTLLHPELYETDVAGTAGHGE
ncbi:hypothetical protein GF314_12335 [bacterium]|nr:hypothetical protein [bacterium]